MTQLPRLSIVCTAGAAALVLLAPALTRAGSAQHRMMIMDRAEGDGEGENMTMSITLPDMKALLEPDYVRDDLPTFEDTLHLSDPQQDIVKGRLEAYLEAFEAMRKAFRESTKGSGVVMFDEPNLFTEDGLAIGGDREAGEDESIGDILREAYGGGDGDLSASGPVMIGIGVTADTGEGPGAGAPVEPAGPEGDEDVVVWAAAGGGEEGEGGGGSGSVRIAIGGNGDVELPPEVIEKLQAKAEEMARKLEEQMAEAEANGEDPGMPLGGPEDLEAHRARLEDLVAAADAFGKDKAKLGAGFVQDVQLQLSPEQMELWPSFERAMTRRKTLPLGRLDGERTDLFRLVDQFGLDDAEQEAVAEELRGYEFDLDEALKRRNEYLDSSRDKLDEALAANDMDAAIDIAGRAARYRVQVRDVNARYAESIALALPGERGEAFRAAALRKAHPRIYRSTVGQRAFDKAGELEELDEDVRTSIDELRIAYLRELAQVNDAIRQAVLRYQPEESRRHFEQMRERLDDPSGPIFAHAGPADDPVRDAYRRRRDLDRRYVARLASVLGPEYEAMLPKAPEKRQPVFIKAGGR